MLVRKGIESDRKEIARLISVVFHREFVALTRNMSKIALALENSIRPARFTVVEEDGRLISIAACSDCNERAVSPIDEQACIEHIGPVMGRIGARVFEGVMAAKLPYSDKTGFLEFVGVDEAHHRRGLATKMLDFIVQNTPYDEYVLDVFDNNVGAQQCYLKFGFLVFDHKKDWTGMFRGFNEKLYMKYIKA